MRKSLKTIYIDMVNKQCIIAQHLLDREEKPGENVVSDLFKVTSCN